MSWGHDGNEAEVAKHEVERCQRAIDRGAAVEFWVNRLTTYASRLEAAAAVLRTEIEALRKAGDNHG